MSKKTIKKTPIKLKNKSKDGFTAKARKTVKKGRM